MAFALTYQSSFFASRRSSPGGPLGTTGLCGMTACDGSQFDITSGAVLHGPAKLALRTYEVRERNGRIEVRD